jgi:predicted transcriptional regulator
MSNESRDKYNILISINPIHIEKIFNGTKKYEFRKHDFTKQLNKALIYSTKPTGQIVGYFTIQQVLKGTPAEIWERCKEFAGSSREAFFTYFKDKNKAYALEIIEPLRYPNPIEPSGMIEGFKAPQSFMYINCDID